MKPLRLASHVALLGLLGCGPLYDDSGTANPGARWPWVCSDGGLAPEAGCPRPACPDSEVTDAGANDGC
jgi:hypothetical protein